MCPTKVWKDIRGYFTHTLEAFSKYLKEQKRRGNESSFHGKHHSEDIIAKTC